LITYLTVKSTTETLATGTLKAIPVNFPLSSGMTLLTALAAPVDAGMMFWAAPLPSLHNFIKKKKKIEMIQIMLKDAFFKD